MRLSRWVAAAAASAAGVLALGTTTTAAAGSVVHMIPPTYYLALGDSLSVGVQPDGSGHEHPTGHGYVNDIYATLRAAQPGLVLTQLGCSGETTRTMISGGVCRYPGAKSQLEAATNLLAAHRGSVQLVTLDIGADNLDRCVSLTAGLDASCVEAGLNEVATDLPVILRKLKSADPEVGVRLRGMTYYDPFLAARLLGPAGRQLADQSLALTNTFNDLLDHAYWQAGVVVAPVGRHFDTRDTAPTTVVGLGAEPRDVVKICTLTWACALPPVGPDIHPNAVGYKVIARTFDDTLAAH